MKQYGLIGKTLTHSFSQKYFADKFIKKEITDCSYINFPVNSVKDVVKIIESNPYLKGLNITIPFKEEIIDYVDEPDEIVKAIGSANTLKIVRTENDVTIKAYNTDVYGFYHSFVPMLNDNHKKALILGTGGSSKAVEFVLQFLKKEYLFVSRKPKNQNQISYADINDKILREYNIIINTTPLGMLPNINSYPNIPYELLNSNNFLFDLVYNPDETEFLKKGRIKQSLIKNGKEMLRLQAEKSWELWNS